MNAAGFDMRSLLERAGFRLRSATRADCGRCEGRSRGTVAFTDKLAYCHRCRWRANTATLARELGLLQGDPKAVPASREDARRRARFGVEIECFERWREARIREISGRHYSLSKAAVGASAVLRKFPDSETAWDALARFYHAEAQLSAAFDWLTFAKASAWLEEDSTAVEVFDRWRSYAA